MAAGITTVGTKSAWVKFASLATLNLTGLCALSTYKCETRMRELEELVNTENMRRSEMKNSKQPLPKATPMQEGEIIRRELDRRKKEGLPKDDLLQQEKFVPYLSIEAANRINQLVVEIQSYSRFALPTDSWTSSYGRKAVRLQESYFAKLTNP